MRAGAGDVLTRYEALIGLLGLVLGMVGTLAGLIWRARGWVDQLNTTDARLVRSVDDLRTTMQVQHAENQRRLFALERRHHWFW